MLEFEKITSVGQFAPLEQEWRAMSVECTSSSIFNSWDWQWIWWQFYGADKAANQPCLNIVIARDCGRLVGIFPLYTRTVRTLKLIPLIELRLIGTGADTSPDYLGPLLSPEFTDDQMNQFCEYIACMPGWDVMRLTDICDNSRFNDALRSVFTKSCLKHEFLPCSLIRFIPLEGGWEDYLKTLSSNKRKQVRRRRRRFEESGATKFYIWSPADPIEKGFDTLVTLHHKRWQNKGNGGSFSTPAYRGLHKSLMQALLPRDALRLYCLEHEGEMIAMEYSYKWKNTIFSFQCGFDPEFSEYRPGQLQLAYSIEHAYSEGIDEYDMLKGDYDYKESAARGQRQTYYFTAYRFTVGGLGARMARCITKFRLWVERLRCSESVK